MIAIENSVDGGVSTAQDALATVPGLRIVGEYLVPVNFVLVARPRAALRWARRGWVGWQLFRRVQKLVS